MCGIAGLLTQGCFQEKMEISLLKMQKALQHRGPDDRGVYISPEGEAAFAHTRLSILDLSPAGHQPMSTANGRYWITFNGEIYNFRELRSQLESQGEKFHSQTDTEVILKLYQQIGSDCVNQLRGMFAFAIWDNQEKTCFLARDPLGIKPLYYWQSGNTLVFASELRAILASGLPTISLSREGLYSYLISGSVPEPLTLIKGIRHLEAGNWLHWKLGDLKQQQYWQIDFTPKAISLPEAVEQTRSALTDSINHHFISDVPVGVFLSGGIDSSAITALASQTQSSQLHTYSIAFEESNWNEGDIAQKVAHKFDTQHTQLTVTKALGKELFLQFLTAIDQPSIDGFNTFCVSKIAQNDGMKVVLSGLGGDELFGGYGSFLKVPEMVKYGKQVQVLKPLSTTIGMGLERWATSNQLKRLGDFLQQNSTTTAAYRSFRGIFSHREARMLLSRYLPDETLSTDNRDWFPGKSIVFENSEEYANLPTIEDEVSQLEISNYMRNQLLRDSDVMSMAWGLELRVPFVDRWLIDVLASIPSSIRLANGKQLLTQAVPELPDWVVNRPKQGFFFPLEEWMKTGLNECFDIQNKPNAISLKPWYRRWSLAILDYWWKEISG